MAANSLPSEHGMFALEKSRLCLIVLHMFFQKAKLMVNWNLAASLRLALASVALTAAGCQAQRPELWTRPMLGPSAGNEFDGVYTGSLVLDRTSSPDCAPDNDKTVRVSNGTITFSNPSFTFSALVDKSGNYYGRYDRATQVETYPNVRKGKITGETMTYTALTKACSWTGVLHRV